MNDQRKMAVLAALKKLKADKKSVQLLEVMPILGDQFSERSVRRWMQELVFTGLVERTGQKSGTRYQLIFKDKATLNENKFSFSTQSQKILQVVQKPLFKRNPMHYNLAWINAYEPNHSFYLSAKHRGILQSVGKPRFHDLPAGTFARKIYDRLLVELSYNSSRLEGNTYSFGETEELIMKGMDAKGKLDAEKIMILNHKEAIRYLVDNAHRLKIDFNTICTIHFLLSEGLVSAKDAGSIRDHSVRIGGSAYIPMDNKARLIKQLIHICVIAEKIENPHEQSFFLLVHIAYLQAFTDVNKRTSRVSANIPFIKNNLYPISFNQIEKDDYISAMLAVYELNDVRVLAELYVYSYLYSSHEYEQLMQSMDVNEVRVRFRKELRSIIRDVIVKKVAKKKLQNYIESHVELLIPAEFQSECIHILQEDFKYLGPAKIAGLGISQKELIEWQQFTRVLKQK